MNELKSSIPGLVYLPTREYSKSSDGFLEGRKQVDGAENLWRINNRLYNLDEFINNHPGGAQWISLTKGTDITELFETHHLSNKAENMLPKFYVRDAKTPRSIPMTFNENGFYKTFKKRSYEALKNINYHYPSFKTNLIADTVMIMTILFCLVSAATQSMITSTIAGVLMTWTTIIGHNYLHMRDNYRMYYLDISLMSSRDWRITHVMSHHMYPNTIWDIEMYGYEPLFQYLPRKKSIIRYLGIFYSPIFWFLSFYLVGIKRYISVFFVNKKIEFGDLVPFIIPIIMCFYSQNIQTAFKIWITIIGISSFVFMFIGFNAAHHHPKIFHDGDICRDDLDWGLLELDAVRDRNVIDDYYFLVVTNFGSHGLHHLLPTIDHAYLPLCLPALQKTCEEFNINNDKFTQIELIKGQFAQLRRTHPEKNMR
ncbi:hypothetical protein HCN44_009516 [Aphidius gifuensis]|uniref:Cytochrome b5 heme-binding domain-containing protein n=1 Tax=Aphidius gifuensis TaxID=684658 RepID=A0A835CY49_APHGI|nr:cytochrome b5-related protein-like [Aphidius gifuensis]KAF7998118.1 hypothetical protein HCN44_009516 [Aphidius gifuensis]